MTPPKTEKADALAGFAKRLRQAKMEYFSNNPVTLASITPFDMIAYDMEKAAKQGEPKEMRAGTELAGGSKLRER